MEENEQNNQIEQNDLKNETKNSINEAKEQMKNLNIKEEAKTGKGLIMDIWKDPLGAIGNNVKDEKNKFYKTALLLVALWTIIAALKQILYYVTSKYVSFNLLESIKVVIAPILEVASMTIAMYIINKNKKKSLSKTITAVTIAYIPVIISSALGLLTYISTSVIHVTNPISGFLIVISNIFVFFTLKALTEEQNDKEAIKTFFKVEGAFYIIYFVLRLLGIRF